MPESWTEIGFWWAPPQVAETSSADQPVASAQPQPLSTGTLSFDGSKSITLTNVAGPLADVHLVDASGAFTGVVPPPVILGAGHSGALYTCTGNFYTGSRQHLIGGVNIAEIDVQAVFKGGHFPSAETQVFFSLSCIYSNLHTWFHDLPCFELQAVEGNSRSFQISHTRTALWNVVTPDSYTLQNDYSFFRNYNVLPEPTWTFSHRDGLKVTCLDRRSVRNFLGFERKFRTLINLLADCQLEIASLTLRQDESIESNFIEYYDRGLRSSFSQRKDARRDAIPVLYSEIASRFNEILLAWLAMYDDLESVVNLYLFGKHNPHLDIGNTFLGLMQSLEGYHRSFYPGSFMPQAEYEANVQPSLNNAIPSSVQGPFRQRLRAAIRFGYEFSFRRRLSDLIADLPNTPTFDAFRNNDFRSRSVDTRNSLTHRVESPDMQIMDGSHLYEAIEMWREVLFALVLGRIGLDAVDVDRAVQRLQAARGRYVTL